MALGPGSRLDLSYPCGDCCDLCGAPWEVSAMDDIYVGIREETNGKKDESLLRQHVCPSCGNVDILTGDEEFDKGVKPILAGDMLDEGVSFYRCAGGFGEFAYRYLPHKCTACGARFTAVKKCEPKINKEVVGLLLLFAFIVAAHIALSMVLIAHGCPAVAGFCGVAAPLLIVYANILDRIDINTDNKDPGPEYICEYGLSDAAFRRLEIAYDERLKDLKAKEAFSVEELEALLKAEDAEDADEEDELELLKQWLQAQQHYILQAADPRQIQCYADGKPLLSFPQPTIRPWDIRPW